MGDKRVGVLRSVLHKLARVSCGYHGHVSPERVTLSQPDICCTSCGEVIGRIVAIVIPEFLAQTIQIRFEKPLRNLEVQLLVEVDG